MPTRFVPTSIWTCFAVIPRQHSGWQRPLLLYHVLMLPVADTISFNMQADREEHGKGFGVEPVPSGIFHPPATHPRPLLRGGHLHCCAHFPFQTQNRLAPVSVDWHFVHLVS